MAPEDLAAALTAATGRRGGPAARRVAAWADELSESVGESRSRVALWDEKRREDRLRAAGLVVIRWIWADLSDFAPTAARLRPALGC